MTIRIRLAQIAERLLARYEASLHRRRAFDRRLAALDLEARCMRAIAEADRRIAEQWEDRDDRADQ